MEGATIDEQITEKPLRSFIKKRLNAKDQGGIPQGTFRNIVNRLVAQLRYPPCMCSFFGSFVTVYLRRPDFRVQRRASEALQYASEELLIERFGDCKELTKLCNIETLRPEHWRFVGREQQQTLLG